MERETTKDIVLRRKRVKVLQRKGDIAKGERKDETEEERVDGMSGKCIVILHR